MKHSCPVHNLEIQRINTKGRRFNSWYPFTVDYLTSVYVKVFFNCISVFSLLYKTVKLRFFEMKFRSEKCPLHVLFLPVHATTEVFYYLLFSEVILSSLKSDGSQSAYKCAQGQEVASKL